MTKLIEFNTQRLRLRQWCEADREPFAKLNANPQVMMFFPSILNRIESDAVAERCQTHINEHGWGFWAVELQHTRKFIGFVGLNVPSMDLPFSPCVEVGWRLDFQHWGQGFATEAARACLHVGFEKLKLTEIVSFTAIGNYKSRAVMKRLGMIEATELFNHPHLPITSPLREHCLCRLSYEQWSNNSRTGQVIRF